MQTIPFLMDKVRVYADNRYTYPENGISFIVHFSGIAFSPAACTIQPSQGSYPLTGNTDMRANVTILRNYGESTFFEAVPLEMLSHDSQTPQISVTIDGMAALCTSLNCDYTYTTPTSSIST